MAAVPPTPPSRLTETPRAEAIEDLRAIDDATAHLAPLTACAEAVGGVDALVQLVRPGEPRCAVCALAALAGLPWCAGHSLVAQLEQALREAP